MSRSNTANTSNDPQHHQQFQQIIQKWEKVKADPAHLDPTEVLCEMADILEKVRYIFTGFWVCIFDSLIYFNF